MRWGIETFFRELKCTVVLLHFHAKKAEHILYEILARLTMYNFSELNTLYSSRVLMLFWYALKSTKGLHKPLRVCADLFYFLIYAIILMTLGPDHYILFTAVAVFKVFHDIIAAGPAGIGTKGADTQAGSEHSEEEAAVMHDSGVEHHEALIAAAGLLYPAK